MKWRFTLSTAFEFSSPVTRHVFRLRPVPANLPGQRVLRAQVRTNSPQPLACTLDPVRGNATWTGRFDDAHEVLLVESSGVVETGFAEKGELPAQPYFVCPTPLTRPGTALLALWERLRGALAGHPRHDALSLMHGVYAAMRYRSGATNTRTTGEQALAMGEGVCQDYAHVLISMLRLAGIPALYVAGLVRGTGATHAWVHAWIDERWVGLDPTHDCPAEGPYVVLARGCDFKEAALDQGIFWGTARQVVRTQALVEPFE